MERGLMQTLVTGASGYIGGKICDRLDLLGMAYRSCGRRNVNRPNYFRCDLACGNLPNDSFGVVIHAAARSSPWGSKAAFQRDNVQATENVINYCRKIGLPKLVFISSSSVYYRNCHQLNISEQTEFAARPVNQYAATKQTAEKLVRSYEGEWVILRPRAVFGPGDTVLLPRILSAARQNKLPLFTTTGPPVIGDLIYIDNLVDYILNAAQSRNIVGEFNLTNNQPIEINGFMLDILQRLGIAAPRRKLSVKTAMRGATALEWIHRLLVPWKEPAITRFGVHVFAYSKTFDVAKSIQAMGQPNITIEEGVRRTVEELVDSSSDTIH
jgi:2-alkyl-3-oxoalkanoate reductase